MILDIIIGVGLILAIVAVWYVTTHHQAPTAPSPKDLTNTVTAGLSDAWAQVKADLPGIVSATVAQLTEDKAVLTAALEAANAKIAADEVAHKAALATVAARVSAAVTASPELPSQPAVKVPAPDFPAAPGPD